MRSFDEIRGAWDIASFEGYRPKRLQGAIRVAHADFRDGGVAVRIECNSSSRAGIVRDGRWLPRPGEETIQTLVGCGPEREARDRRLFAFFQGSPTVERDGADRLRLRAGRRELVLERPALRRLSFVPTPAELGGKWRLLELVRFEPSGGYTGIGLSETPGRILISGDRLLYNRCPRYEARVRFEPRGRLFKTAGLSPSELPADCPALFEPAAHPSGPARHDLLRVLHRSPLVEKAGPDTLLLSTDRLGLLVTRAPCMTQDQSDDHRTVVTRDCTPPE